MPLNQIEGLKAEVESLTRQLEECRKAKNWSVRVYHGKDYFSREQVKPLLEALQSFVSPMSDCESWNRFIYKREAALTHAKSIGL